MSGAQRLADGDFAGPHPGPRRRQVDIVDSGNEKGQHADNAQRKDIGTGLGILQVQVAQRIEARMLDGMWDHGRKVLGRMTIDESRQQ